MMSSHRKYWMSWAKATWLSATSDTGRPGKSDRLNSQPIVVNHHKGRMALAHNGNLVNSHELRQELEAEGSIFHTTSDTEVISYIITKERIKSDSIEEAIDSAMDKLIGAYSLVIMSPSKLIAVRDELGMRPLCYGQKEDGTYIIASETCALDAVSAKYVREIEPGEIVIFEKDGVRSIKDHCNKQPQKLCIFEYIYFARPDSVVEGMSVHEARLEGRAPALPWNILFRQMWLSAYLTPDLTQRSVTPDSRAFHMASDSSKTNTSAEPLLHLVKKRVRTRFVSNSTWWQTP